MKDELDNPQPGTTLKELAESDGATSIGVVGASGFIGKYLTLNLLQMGYRLHLLSHKTNPDFVSVRGQVRTFSGAIEDEAAMQECFRGCEVVFHLVGIIAETRHKTFQKTVADGTATLVRAARKAGVRKIIYLSALGTSESAKTKYHASKWAAERHVINSGLAYTVFRPSIVYGLEDKFINMIARMIRQSPLIPVIGDGRYKLQPVYVEELCAVMAASSRGTAGENQTFEIGGPEALTYLEIVDILKRLLRIRRPVVHIPLPLVRVGAAILERMVKPAPLTTDMLKMMLAGSTCDQTVAERAFGVKFTALEFQLSKYLGRKDGRFQL